MTKLTIFNKFTLLLDDEDKTEIEAARAYNEAAKELFGEFAILNKIGDEKE